MVNACSWRPLLIAAATALPVSLRAQSSPPPEAMDGVMIAFEREADYYGGRLVQAFDSIPANRYDYQPTPAQQTIGFVAQHLEDANYGLCSRFADLKHPGTAKDSLADSLKAKWPKDTLVTRLEASLQFCDSALERAGHLQSPALASNLLLFETDLAEHYSQISSYMRLLGMVPPSALPRKKRTAIELPASDLARYPGVYELAPGLDLDVTMPDNALMVRGSGGGNPVHLWPESRDHFFVNEVDAQITFVRDASGTVRGLILHQYGREKQAKKVK
jgi:hypothetical protein